MTDMEKINKEHAETKKKVISLRPRHDALFKESFSNIEIAKAFLNHYMPMELQEIVDFKGLKVESGSYVDSSLKNHYSDIVYSVPMKDGDEAYIYTLLEHQSTSDPYIALRLWKYTILFLERIVKEKKKLPIIWPVVVYSGKEAYKAARNLWDLFDDPKTAKNYLTKDYRLIDLQAMSDNEIFSKKNLGVIEYFLKNIHQKNLLNMWKEIAKRNLLQLMKSFDIKILLRYTEEKINASDLQTLTDIMYDNVDKEKAEEIMKSIAESYVEQGFEKGIILGEQRGKMLGINEGKMLGINEGKYQVAKNMLTEGLTPQVVAKYSGLKLQEVQKLKGK